MDERIGACHHRGEALPLRKGRQQNAMGITANRSPYPAAITPLSYQHEPDRTLVGGGSYRIDDHRPPLFRCQSPDAQQQRGIFAQSAVAQQSFS